MKPKTSDEIRQAFLEYFDELGHEVVPSAPLPQFGNPTLLFTNAGMNQFVDVFLGKEKRPYSRAASVQKCMRVQGKHNDLENVGPSPRHHTFFEMLGNFSFGDYFKAGAIRFAYDFMTRVCGAAPDRLWYTVHTSDDDAYRIWIDEIGVPAERVLRMGDKTNFWMMGDVGPCGPTSEIHYDWGPEYCTCRLPNCSVLLDNDCGRWLEVWNLVFMQFDQDEAGNRTPLPRPGVDTGMGLERITSVVQHTPVNYDTDIFRPALDRIQALLGDSDDERRDKHVGYRVIADHNRAATFLIADGVRPGNTGAGYVLRMIIRRAARFGRKIGFDRPFLAEVARVYIDEMEETYPELNQRRELILHTLTQEEERFARTLDAALAQLQEIIDDLRRQGRREISGAAAFNLYASQGLPLEITRDVVQEQGFTVDEAGYNAARVAHAEASGAGAFGEYEVGSNTYAVMLEQLTAEGRLGDDGIDYDPYRGTSASALIIGWVEKEGTGSIDSKPVEIVRPVIEGKATVGSELEIVTNVTPFYVEAGGEVSDIGTITTPTGEFQVEDTRQPVPGLILHAGKVVRGEISIGQVAELQVDDVRRADIRRNHTATHILHRELRHHLGNHVAQAGSLVAPDRLRFDFTHDKVVDRATLAAIEADINRVILANRPVEIRFMGQREAIAAGAMALFGEKYGDVVRTIQIGAGNGEGPYSFELCGGLHVERTGDIGPFRFISESAVAAGVRRVEAVTGSTAQALVTERLDVLERVAGKLNAPITEVETRLESVLAENRALNKDLERLQRQAARGQFESLLSQVHEVAGATVLATSVNVADLDGLRQMADWFRDKVKSGAAVFGAVINDKPMFVATVTGDLIERGLKAGDIVREVARIVGGGGGGRPDLAQAGGKDAGKLAEALAAVPALIEKALNNA